MQWHAHPSLLSGCRLYRRESPVVESFWAIDVKLRGRIQDINELEHFKFPTVRLAFYIYTLTFVFESVTISDINTWYPKTTEDKCFMGEILIFFSYNKMETPERGCGSGTDIMRYYFSIVHYVLTAVSSFILRVFLKSNFFLEKAFILTKVVIFP